MPCGIAKKLKKKKKKKKIFFFFKADHVPTTESLSPEEKLRMTPDIEKQNIITTFWVLVAEPRT